MLNDGQLRCAHGYPAVVKEEDGWKVPYAGEKCAACKGAQIGRAYKEGGEGQPKQDVPAPLPATVCTVTEGCILFIGTSPHTAPCLTEAGERLPHGGDDRDMVDCW